MGCHALLPAGVVVVETELLAGERFSAASLAVTVKVYAVFPVNPLTVAVVLLVDKESVVPLYTLYPTTAMLSLEALHDNDTVEEVVAVMAKLAGVVGGCVSITFAVVVTVTVLLVGDKLPAASFAFTVKSYVVLAVKSLIVALVLVTVAADWEPKYTM
nr:hypothetical protein [Paenibacillus glacialis]